MKERARTIRRGAAHGLPAPPRVRAAILAAIVGTAAGTIAGGIAALGGEGAPELPAAWMPLFPGVAWTEVATAEPRVLRIVAVRVDLEEPGIDFVVTPPNGERPLETDGLRTSTFLRKHGCQVAVNASPFRPIVSREGESQDVLGLSVSRGERYSEPEPGCGALVLERGNRARIEAPPVEGRGAQNAVGGFGIIVREGENVGSDDALHPRTAAGVSRDGRYLILLAIDGRQADYSLGATTRETADWLLRLGAFQGLNLDGGGSTAIAIEGRDGAPVLLNRPIHSGLPGRERVCANHLGVFAPKAPADVPVEIARDAPPAPLGPDEAADLTADFRYSPPWWQVAICLPDDGQKTLVSREGDLLYDYRGPEGFGTRVSIAVEGAEGCGRSQELASPRVPIVETRIERGPETLAAWKSFAVAPGGELPEVEGERRSVAVELTTRPTPLPGWGSPAVPAVDAFRNILAGFDGPIGYRFRSAHGARYALAFGFLESHHAEPGKRIVEVFVEGRKAARLDLVADAGRHRPRVVFAEAEDADGDGYVRFEVRPAPESEDQYPILNALWVFPAKLAPSAEDLIAGRYRTRALAEIDCGGSGALGAPTPGPPRADLALIRRAPGAGRIEVRIGARESLVEDEDRRGVYRGGGRFLGLSAPWAEARRDGEALVLAFPEALAELAVLCASGYDAGNPDLAWAKAQVARATEYWSSLSLPYEKIRVPDPAIQALLDASIRNIYQAREMREGLPIFQVGPTCYRGLWIVDGTFILEAMTYLGGVEEARAGIEHLLRRAKPDGSFETIPKYWKENGIVLYLLYRHALLTQDRAWLAERWHVLQNLVAAIQRLRIQSRADPSAPEAGLMPPGFPDGGVGGHVPEYTNVYWNLVGLKAAVGAAKYLGRDTLETTAWEAEYEGLLDAFRRAAARDARKDEEGRPYLPILMRDDPSVHPVRGQWAFCHAVHPGEIFERAAPIVLGNMALLGRNEREGLVLGTGWMADGIWNYFASFWAHAHLSIGNGPKAARILYAFANHACPLLAWREEQHPAGGGWGLVGDMPHNWASAEFIRLIRNLLVFERGRELHLLEGLPRTWLRPGARTELDRIFTNFGPVSLRLQVSEDGRELRLLLEPPRREPPEKIAIHLGAWAAERAFSLGRSGGAVEARIPLER